MAGKLQAWVTLRLPIRCSFVYFKFNLSSVLRWGDSPFLPHQTWVAQLGAQMPRG